jgi:hypothetical protein
MGEETYGASRVVRAYCCPQPNERYFALVKKRPYPSLGLFGAAPLAKLYAKVKV